MGAIPISVRMRTALALATGLGLVKVALIKSVAWNGPAGLSAFRRMNLGPIALAVSLPLLAWVIWVAWRAGQRDNDVRTSLLLLVGADICLLLLIAYFWRLA